MYMNTIYKSINNNKLFCVHLDVGKEIFKIMIQKHETIHR